MAWEPPKFQVRWRYQQRPCQLGQGSKPLESVTWGSGLRNSGNILRTGRRDFANHYGLRPCEGRNGWTGLPPGPRIDQLLRGNPSASVSPVPSVPPSRGSSPSPTSPASVSCIEQRSCRFGDKWELFLSALERYDQTILAPSFASLNQQGTGPIQKAQYAARASNRGQVHATKGTGEGGA